MKQETFLVQPLGKYGHTYLLSQSTYRLYMAFNAVVYIIIGLLAVSEIVIPNVFGVVLLPSNMFLMSLVAIGLVGMRGVLEIASRGRIVYGDEASEGLKTKSKAGTSLLNLGIILICILSGIFSLVLILAILFGMMSHQPVSPNELIILALVLYAFVHYCHKWQRRQ